MAIGDGNSMLEAALGAAGLHSQNDQSSPPSWGSPNDTSVDNATPTTNTTGSDTDLGSPVFPLVNGRYYIEPDKENIFGRVLHNFAYDKNELTGGGDGEGVIDTTIFELLPTPLVLPKDPPKAANIYAANWSRIVNYGGILDGSKKELANLTTVEDWSIEEWQVRHQWPSKYTLDPIYLFFTGDAATFYVGDAIDYEHPTDGLIPPDPNKIIWRLNGQEVHKGWYLDMDGLDITVQDVGIEKAGTDELLKILEPSILTVDITNDAGVLTKTIKFGVVDSENVDGIAGFELQGSAENFSAIFTGRFKALATPYTGVNYIYDERYQNRKLYMRFKWKGIGGGESPVRKFKDGNAKVWIDGIEVWKDKAIILDGQRSAMGEFLDDWGAPVLTVLGGAAVMLLGGGFLVAGIVSALGLLSSGVGFGFDWSELFNSDGTPAYGSLSEYNDDPNTEQNVTDKTSESDLNSSALLYVPPDDDEWRALLEVEKPPGPMDIKVKYDFTYRTGFANLGKKYRRTYEFNKSLDIDLDEPLQPIDIGMHTVNYTDERV